MMFITSLVLLSSAILPCFAQSGNVRVTYNTLYDDPSWPLSSTACSNGVNGLENKWPTLGDVPNYPFVAGIPGLVWNSTLCGTCWQLEYDANGTKSLITVIAVDEAGTFDVAEAAFSSWLGNSGVAAGAVNATATQLSPSDCGIY